MKRPRLKKETRKKINRSGNFPCDCCEEIELRVEHHIKGRCIPNYNHPSNLANVCPNCHQKIHEGKIIIEGWFYTSEGKKLLWHKAIEQSFSGRELVIPLTFIIKLTN